MTTKQPNPYQSYRQWAELQLLLYKYHHECVKNGTVPEFDQLLDKVEQETEKARKEWRAWNLTH